MTRTLHFGTPTAGEIRAFTRVLQGHIAIETAVFPSGTTGEFGLDEREEGKGKRREMELEQKERSELTLSFGLSLLHKLL